MKVRGVLSQHDRRYLIELDCGTTRISEEMIKNNIKAQTSNLDNEIDKIKFYMHDGQK